MQNDNMNNSDRFMPDWTAWTSQNVPTMAGNGWTHDIDNDYELVTGCLNLPREKKNGL